MSHSPKYRILALAILLFAPVVASAQELTVMELLENRRQFEDRRVTVSGYYFSDSESHHLYADLKAAKAYDSSRSICISAQPDIRTSIRKARISGVFFYSRNYRPKRGFSGFGMWGLCPAELINCTLHLQREATPAPNQSLQLTAGRSDASHKIMKTLPLQTTLAPASGS